MMPRGVPMPGSPPPNSPGTTVVVAPDHDTAAPSDPAAAPGGVADTASFTVDAIYGRADIPRYEELPEDYAVSDMDPEQIFCRRRYRTRPPEGPADGECAGEFSGEFGGYDRATFVPGRGLVDGEDYFWDWEFWHLSEDIGAEHLRDHGVFGDRAVLFQTADNYAALATSVGVAGAGPLFGEQVVVRGGPSSPSGVCVGDRYAARGGALVVEVTAPRLCSAAYVDAKCGRAGTARYCNARGLGGWFARVVAGGELADGDVLVRTARPHPEWNLAYLSGALYGEEREREGEPEARWTQGHRQLEELCGLERLGLFGWRIEAQKLLEKMEGGATEGQITHGGGDPAASKRTEVSTRTWTQRLLSRTNPEPDPALAVVALCGRRDPHPDDPNDSHYCRRRLPARAHDTDDHDDAGTYTFVPVRGLLGHGNFTNVTDRATCGITEERAVLFQSLENYQEILAHPRLGTLLGGADALARGLFGEQVLVRGRTSAQVCVGDVYSAHSSSLVVEVASPRKVCGSMDGKFGGPHGAASLRVHANATAAAGWFARVTTAGTLSEGDALVLTARPHPRWTLERVAAALYGEGTDGQRCANRAVWKRSRRELEELVGLEQLGENEWREEARRLLEAMDGGGHRWTLRYVAVSLADMVRQRWREGVKDAAVMWGWVHIIVLVNILLEAMR